MKIKGFAIENPNKDDEKDAFEFELLGGCTYMKTLLKTDADPTLQIKSADALFDTKTGLEVKMWNSPNSYIITYS